MKTRQDWEKQRDEARAALWAIDAEEKKARSTDLVGRCFRFRNNYGAGSNGGDWWLYIRVSSVSENSWPQGLKFETTCNDEIRIEANALFTTLEHYDEIPYMEFAEAWNDLQKRLGAIGNALP